MLTFVDANAVSRSAASFATAAATVLQLGLVGCASVEQSIEQPVRVETPGCAAVTCELSNDRGRWVLQRTPGTVIVKTSHSPLAVNCRADDGTREGRFEGPSQQENTGAGAVVGGAAGGAAIGAVFGTTALMFIPPLGVMLLATGIVAGAAAGQVAESGQHPFRYPEQVSFPMRCVAVAGDARPAGAALGLGIRGLLPPEARAAGVGERGAVLVTSVRPDSRADAAGLRTGDVIVGAGDQALRDAAELQARLLAQPPGTSITLRVWRNEQFVVVVLAPRAEAP